MRNLHENTTRKYFFKPDLDKITDAIEKLKRELLSLGLEQGEASKQSGENMGHDDFAQEDIQRRRTILLAKIKLLENNIKGAEIINKNNTPSEIIRIGNQVTLEAENGDARTYTISSYFVFGEDGDAISYDSPLSRSLLGKSIGCDVTIQGIVYTITQVRL